MKYTISETPLRLREYGRHVQSMIEHAIAQPDREQRNKLAQEIIRVMINLNPQVREILDYKKTLWDYLFIASDGKLDIDYPYERPDLTKLEYIRPPKVPYSQTHARFKQYGSMVVQMIQQAVETEDEEEKRNMVNIIASTMRQLQRNMDKDAAPESVIVEHIRELSKGKLRVKADELVLNKAVAPPKPAPRSNYGGYNNNNRNRNRNRKRKGK